VRLPFLAVLVVVVMASASCTRGLSKPAVAGTPDGDVQVQTVQQRGPQELDVIEVKGRAPKPEALIMEAPPKTEYVAPVDSSPMSDKVIDDGKKLP